MSRDTNYGKFSCLHSFIKASFERTSISISVFGWSGDLDKCPNDSSSIAPDTRLTSSRIPINNFALQRDGNDVNKHSKSIEEQSCLSVLVSLNANISTSKMFVVTFFRFIP